MAGQHRLDAVFCPFQDPEDVLLYRPLSHDHEKR
jgi:hypothetical protein